MSRKEKQKGITLISLVITVIILLILAAVAINLAVDSNGLFRKAGDAANKWNSSVAEEGQTLKDMLSIADEIAPPEVWYKIDGTTLYFSSSQKDEGYKLAKSRYDGEFPEWRGSDITIETVTFEDEVTPISTAGWFACPSLTQINNIKYLNTSKVTDMSFMFSGCGATTLDLSSFDTSNVTDMRAMFGDCGVTTLDLSSFDTSRVTDMSQMFLFCGVTELNLNSFNTENVIYMDNMFRGCSELTKLEINNFNTSNVEHMFQMFMQCSKLENIDLSSFDTSNVTWMSQMFENCSSLTSLDLGNFDTTNVQSMREMFDSCSSLTYLNLSKATFGSITNPIHYGNMFRGMANDVTIKVKDEAAKTFIQSRLNDDVVTATVEINTTP